MNRAAFLLFAICALAVERHPVTAGILKIDRAHRSFEASCQAIPGYMAAMEMPFAVRDASELTGLTPGTAVSFTIVENGKQLLAEKIQVRGTANLESEPLQAGQLTALHRALNPAAAATVLAVGPPVPDFALTDQAGRRLRGVRIIGAGVGFGRFVGVGGMVGCPNFET